MSAWTRVSVDSSIDRDPLAAGNTVLKDPGLAR
jgi:hypothetical protein